MLPQRMLLMRAGDVHLCDFGTPAEGEPGYLRPAVVVTTDEVLEFEQHALAVVPLTTTRRNWLSEVNVAEFGVAQAQLVTTISVNRVVEESGSNVGPITLRQNRELLSDLLGI
jgi:mRNA interferase MazF